MNFPKLVVTARITHRFLVWVIIILGLIMMLTGSAMKFPEIALIDPLQARQIHNVISTLFSIVLFLMMLTGAFMYLYPWLQKILVKKPATS